MQSEETPKDFMLNTAHWFANQDCVHPKMQPCTKRLSVMTGKWCTNYWYINIKIQP